MYGKDEKDTTSRENVKNNGEVFTPFVIVEKMLDLIPTDFMANPSACIIEPTSGNGQFLVKIVERRLSTGMTIENTVNSIIGMEINHSTLLESHLRIYQRVCDQMTVMGIIPQSDLWFEMAVRIIAIVRNNVFKVTDSLTVMNDYKSGKGLLAKKKFVFSDPTGNNEVMTDTQRNALLSQVNDNFRNHNNGKKTKTLAPFFGE
jgi:hypothetical protein